MRNVARFGTQGRGFKCETIFMAEQEAKTGEGASFLDFVEAGIIFKMIEYDIIVSCTSDNSDYRGGSW